MQAAPDGRALRSGRTPALSLIDTGCPGALDLVGTRDALYRSYGNYAAVRRRALPGDRRRLGHRGRPDRRPDPHGDHRRRRGPAARSRAPTGSLTTARRQHNLTVLADGFVLATGGQSTNGGGGLVDLAHAVYAAERSDPATGAWTDLASAAVAPGSTTRPPCCCPTAGC